MSGIGPLDSVTRELISKLDFMEICCGTFTEMCEISDDWSALL